jgi:cyclophilin family peptidyl-prolyl cis-trans isomerase
MEDTRRDEPVLVDSLLEHGSARLRARAALAAGRIGARSHLVRIRQVAGDLDSAVAAAGWFSLTLLRDSVSAPAAMTQLRSALPVSRAAARFLGEVGDAGRAGLVAALADSSIGPAVRGELLLAASRVRLLPVSAIAPWVGSSDSALAWRAAYALARARSAAGVRPLLTVARSPFSALREQVARGVSRPTAGDSLGDTARAVLTTLLDDSVARVRINAVRALATYGATARAHVLAMLHDRDAGVRIAAAQSLGGVLDSTPAPWECALAEDTALVFQAAVLDGAAARGVTLAVLREWRHSSEWRRRAATVGAASHGTADSMARRLSGWLADRDPRVRAAAAAALAGAVDSAAARDVARAGLRSALRDDDPMVRAAALDGLAKGATGVDLELAMDAYARRRRDREPDARLAFWKLADSALARAGSLIPDSTRRRLSRITRPSDPLERVAAAHIPRFATWLDSSGTARPLAWYEARAREVGYHPLRTARIETSRGIMTLALYAWDAPLTVYSFASLAKRHYFDGQRFHRVVPNFVIQGGDPRGDGNGGPGYAIRDEINDHRYGRGTLGMALSGPDTGGSQFFVTHSPQPHLDGGYTVFGQLESGYDVLDRIVQGDLITRVTVR